MGYPVFDGPEPRHARLGQQRESETVQGLFIGESAVTIESSASFQVIR